MAIFVEKNDNFCQFFLEKMTSFWQFFDSQMAIFRRVRLWVYHLVPMNSTQGEISGHILSTRVFVNERPTHLTLGLQMADSVLYLNFCMSMLEKEKQRLSTSHG